MNSFLRKLNNNQLLASVLLMGTLITPTTQAEDVERLISHIQDQQYQSLYDSVRFHYNLIKMDVNVDVIYLKDTAYAKHNVDFINWVKSNKSKDVAEDVALKSNAINTYFKSRISQGGNV